jgi:hypothetical protein
VCLAAPPGHSSQRPHCEQSRSSRPSRFLENEANPTHGHSDLTAKLGRLHLPFPTSPLLFEMCLTVTLGTPLVPALAPHMMMATSSPRSRTHQIVAEAGSPKNQIGGAKPPRASLDMAAVCLGLRGAVLPHRSVVRKKPGAPRQKANVTCWRSSHPSKKKFVALHAAIWRGETGRRSHG